MKTSSVFAVIILVSILTACNTTGGLKDIGAHETGTFISQEKLSLAIDGTSKQSDISKEYGHPNRKEQVGNKEIWYYDYNKIRHVGSNISEATVFEFDNKGLLSQHYKTNSSGESGNALLDASKK